MPLSCLYNLCRLSGPATVSVADWFSKIQRLITLPVNEVCQMVELEFLFGQKQGGQKGTHLAGHCSLN